MAPLGNQLVRDGSGCLAPRAVVGVVGFLEPEDVPVLVAVGVAAGFVSHEEFDELVQSCASGKSSGETDAGGLLLSSECRGRRGWQWLIEFGEDRRDQNPDLWQVFAPQAGQFDERR